MLVIFGVLVTLLALYFWKLGNTPTSRVLVIPFLVVGFFWAIVPGAGLFRNKVRLEAFRAEHKKDPAAFVESERKRVEGFMGWYRPLTIGWAVLLVVGLGLFHFWGGNLGRAIGLAVILFGVAGLMVDYTSEQNAHKYHGEVVKALKTQGGGG